MRRTTALLTLSVLSGSWACASGGGAIPPATPSPAQVDTVRIVDTVTIEAEPVFYDSSALQADPFDNGKMWTFEYPPLEYFREAYGFTPDSAWFRQAHLGALRLPNCSASFVSPRGLVLTNHHCAREMVSQVSQEGEQLLDNGFYAAQLSDERAVQDTHIDRLVEIVDVSAEFDTIPVPERTAYEETVSTRLANARGGEEAGIVVEIISLWNGAKTSAYVFRRYQDVRLVMAPELQLGYFGGDPDNFTYPRYALDMSFLRVYGDDGNPVQPDNYFTWSTEGVSEGDAVFIIGNPGSTSRLQTVAELEFRRDVSDVATLEFLNGRIAALREYIDENPEEAEEFDVRNKLFSLLNSQKAYTGILEGLRDPAIIARRRDAQEAFQDSIESTMALRNEYGDLFAEMASVQDEKRQQASQLAAFAGLGSPDYTSGVLLRGIFALQYLSGQGGGAPAEALEGVAELFREVGRQPEGLQWRLLAARLQDMQRHLGSSSRPVSSILQGRSPEAAARAIVSASILSDSGAAVNALEAGTIDRNDPAVQLALPILQAYGQFQGAFTQLTDRESEIANQLGRARFDVYGTSQPPDATFSLRIADGRVEAYEYNGTVAPIYTTFYGLYDHYYSYGPDSEWKLPERWVNRPRGLDLETPFNFISTADIIGGNSGSPVLNSDLEVVGVVFDGNIESLPGDYIYLPTKNRSVAVDARGILEALRDVYGAQRIVSELTGR